MRILFMGTPDFAVPCLARLIADGHEIVGVLTQPDKPQGRKMKLTPPPVKALALEHGLAVHQPDSLKDGAILPLLEETRPELIVVVAYGKILPAYVLDFPKFGCINVHGSLLPRWRGAAPIQWSVIAGDRYAGVTTMKMACGLDTGDMLLTYQTEIGARETAGELFDRLAEAGAALLSETIAKLPEIVPQPQDESFANYASMLDKELAVVDWHKTALGGARMKIFAAELSDRCGAPGEVLEADAKKGLLVACGDGALHLTEIQMVGGKRMNACDYLRGHAIEKGTVLGA